MNKNKRVWAFTLCTALIAALGMMFCACQSTGRSREKPFDVNWDAPRIQIGEIELQLEEMAKFGKLSKASVPVYYFPDDDVVGLYYRYNYFNYYQCWDWKGRDAFCKALVSYHHDYDARELNSSSRNSMRSYGFVVGYLVWQQLSFTLRAYANMTMELGYGFKDRAPYFTVNQREAEYVTGQDGTEHGESGNRISEVITLYFTRAQAAKLTELFDQDYLNGFADTKHFNFKIEYEKNDDTGRDDY